METLFLKMHHPNYVPSGITRQDCIHILLIILVGL